MTADPPPTTVAITGATGYVGSRLAAVMAALDHITVRALVRRAAPLPAAVHQVKGDLLGPAGTLEQLCDGADAVVHLAGPNETVASRDPETAVNDVISGSFRLAAAMGACGVPRAIYLSTVHVYGAQLRSGAVVTEETLCEPRSPYAIARLSAEHILASAGIAQLVVFRVTNSVGAPASPEVDRWSLVANDLCRQGAVDGVLRLRTTGTQWRDFLSLADVCEVVADAAAGRVRRGIYNLGMGESITIRALAACVQEAFVEAGASCPPLEAPDPEPDPAGPYRVSVERLAAAGFRPRRTVADAVLETVRFCLHNRRDLDQHCEA